MVWCVTPEESAVDICYGSLSNNRKIIIIVYCEAHNASLKHDSVGTNSLSLPFPRSFPLSIYNWLPLSRVRTIDHNTHCDRDGQLGEWCFEVWPYVKHFWNLWSIVYEYYWVKLPEMDDYIMIFWSTQIVILKSNGFNFIINYNVVLYFWECATHLSGLVSNSWQP